MTLQGTTRTYELDGLGLNARCRVEEVTGRPFVDVMRELAGKRRPRVATVHQFLSALLVNPVQPDPTTVGLILKDVGGVPVLRKAAQAAWRVYRPSRRRRAV